MRPGLGDKQEPGREGPQKFQLASWDSAAIERIQAALGQWIEYWPVD